MSKVVAATRFQVVEFEITQKGQIVKQSVKIPRSAARVKSIAAMSYVDTGNLGIPFRFFGVSTADHFAMLTIDEMTWEHISEIQNLSFERTITANTDQKIYYAHPVRLGLVTFLIDGEQGGFKAPTYLNSPGSLPGVPYLEPYYAWESNDLGLQAATITILPV
jgi:hypothetical protein